MKRKSIRQWSIELNIKPFHLLVAALELKGKHWSIRDRIAQSTAIALKVYFFKKYPNLRS